MKIKGNTLVLAIIMAIMLVIIVSSLTMEYFESKLLPLIVASVALVLATIGLVREILTEDKRKVTVTDEEGGQRDKSGEGWRGYLLNGAWVGGFASGIFLLGFFVTVPLFILSYMRWLGTRWRVAIVFAILTPVFLYGLFELALRVDLYPGLLFKWLDRLT